MEYRNCISDRSARHQAIFEQGLLVVMTEKPYSDITVSDLCKQSGFSRKSFYHYFGSKDGCLCALVDHTIQNMHLEDNLLPNGRLCMVKCFQYWKSRRTLLDVLHKNHMTNLLLNRMLVLATTERGFRDFLAGDRYDGTLEQVVFILGGMVGILLNWHLSDYEKSPEELGGIMERLVEQALTARPPME